MTAANTQPSHGAAPRKVVAGDDTMTADAAYRLAKAGTAIAWEGDFQNARQLLSALSRRVAKKGRASVREPAIDTHDLAKAFRKHRAERFELAKILGMLLVPLDANYTIPLRRAPDVAQACEEAYGPATAEKLVSLRELQGVIGAHEWRHSGVYVAPLDARIYPHYGVFSPIRGEYLELAAKAELPQHTTTAFDIGTGTGVLAAILAHRGVANIVATDQDPRAVACATDNLERLGFADKASVLQKDLFPEGTADLIVCNPPWIPATPASPLDFAVYDPDSDMLRRFLAGMPAHLNPGGEGWLIISDLAERLGLRSRAELLSMIADAGLTITDRLDTVPTHSRAQDSADPLHAARSAEVTSLWRLSPST